MNLSWRIECLMSRVRVWRWRAEGVVLGQECRIGAGVRLRRRFMEGRRGRIELGAGADLGEGVVFDTWGGDIIVGRQVFLGPHVVIYGYGGVEVGDQTLISMQCRILSSNHVIPAFGTDIRTQPNTRLPTKIGRDVWLGAGVTVLGGVNIGDGCVVGAGAVVTKSLPPGAIAMGVPALVKGFRAGAPNAR